MAKLTEQIKNVINQYKNIFKEEIYINNKHEYDYYKDTTCKNIVTHTLYYSDSEDWNKSLQKTIAMQIIDNGNSIKIIDICDKKNLNYLEAEQLHILLRLSSEHNIYEIAPTPLKKEF